MYHNLLFHPGIAA